MAAEKRKVIITCAVTGAPRAAAMTARPPATSEEIAEQAIESARAGAAILHLHARAPHEGGAAHARGIVDRLVPRIAAETDAIISITTGGDPTATLEARLAYPLKVRPELCSLSLASASLPAAAEGAGPDRNFTAEPRLGERPETTRRDETLDDVRRILARFADAPGTRFAFECHEVGHLHGLRRLMDEGLVEGPVFLQYGLGAGLGRGGEPESLSLLCATADRLFGRENHEFSVFGAGRQQMSVLTMGAILGGHVRVGLDDGSSVSRGPLAMSCSAQVLKVRRILDELSLAIASPAEAREILQTKGAAKVNFDG